MVRASLTPAAVAVVCFAFLLPDASAQQSEPNDTISDEQHYVTVKDRGWYAKQLVSVAAGVDGY